MRSSAIKNDIRKTEGSDILNMFGGGVQAHRNRYNKVFVSGHSKSTRQVTPKEKKGRKYTDITRSAISEVADKLSMAGEPTWKVATVARNYPGGMAGVNKDWEELRATAEQSWREDFYEDIPETALEELKVQFMQALVRRGEYDRGFVPIEKREETPQLEAAREYYESVESPIRRAVSDITDTWGTAESGILFDIAKSLAERSTSYQGTKSWRERHTTYYKVKEQIEVAGSGRFLASLLGTRDVLELQSIIEETDWSQRQGENSLYRTKINSMVDRLIASGEFQEKILSPSDIADLFVKDGDTPYD